MPGQGSRHITVADLKADHVGPSLDAVIDEIDQPSPKRTPGEREDQQKVVGCSRDVKTEVGFSRRDRK